MNEKELLAGIELAEQDRLKFKKNITRLRSQITETESDLIEVTIKKDRLIEQLRTLHNSTVSHEVTERELEIEAFRQRFPEYSKRIDEENKTVKLKK